MDGFLFANQGKTNTRACRSMSRVGPFRTYMPYIAFTLFAGGNMEYAIHRLYERKWPRHEHEQAPMGTPLILTADPQFSHHQRSSKEGEG
eukprot:1159645-Pelagomonas_calceolata.AAC.6